MTHPDVSSVFLKCEPLRKAVFLSVVQQIDGEVVSRELSCRVILNYSSAGDNSWVRVCDGGNLNNSARKRLGKWNHDGPMYRIWFQLRRVCRAWKGWVDLAAAEYYQSVTDKDTAALIVSPFAVPFEKNPHSLGPTLPLRTHYWPLPLKKSLLKFCWRRLRIGFRFAQGLLRRIEDLSCDDKVGHNLVRSFPLWPFNPTASSFNIYDDCIPSSSTVYVPTTDCFDERADAPSDTTTTEQHAITNQKKLHARIEEMKLA